MRRYCYPAIQQYSNAGILNYLPVHISAKQRGDRRKDMQVNKPSKNKEQHGETTGKYIDTRRG